MIILYHHVNCTHFEVSGSGKKIVCGSMQIWIRNDALGSCSVSDSSLFSRDTVQYTWGCQGCPQWKSPSGRMSWCLNSGTIEGMNWSETFRYRQDRWYIKNIVNKHFCWFRLAPQAVLQTRVCFGSATALAVGSGVGSRHGMYFFFFFFFFFFLFFW